MQQRYHESGSRQAFRFRSAWRPRELEALAAYMKTEGDPLTRPQAIRESLRDWQIRWSTPKACVGTEGPNSSRRRHLRRRERRGAGRAAAEASGMNSMQCRMARAALNWTTRKLQQEADVPSRELQVFLAGGKLREASPPVFKRHLRTTASFSSRKDKVGASAYSFASPKPAAPIARCRPARRRTRSSAWTRRSQPIG